MFLVPYLFAGFLLWFKFSFSIISHTSQDLDFEFPFVQYKLFCRVSISINKNFFLANYEK